MTATMICGMVSNLVTVVHGDVCIVEVWVLVGGGEAALVGRTPVVVVVVVHLPPPLAARPMLRPKVVHAPLVTLAPIFTSIASFAPGQLKECGVKKKDYAELQCELVIPLYKGRLGLNGGGLDSGGHLVAFGTRGSPGSLPSFHRLPHCCCYCCWY